MWKRISINPLTKSATRHINPSSAQCSDKYWLKAEIRTAGCIFHDSTWFFSDYRLVLPMIAHVNSGIIVDYVLIMDN